MMNKLHPIPALLVLALFALMALMPSASTFAYPPPGDDPTAPPFLTPTISLTPTLRCGQGGRICTAMPSGTINAERTGTAAVQQTYEAKLTEWRGATQTAIASITPLPPLPTPEEPPYPGPSDPIVKQRWYEVFLPAVSK